MRVNSLIGKDIDLKNSQLEGQGTGQKKINLFVLRQNCFVISLPPSFYCATRARGSLLISTCFSQNINPFLHDLLTLPPVAPQDGGMCWLCSPATR